MNRKFYKITYSIEVYRSNPIVSNATFYADSTSQAVQMFKKMYGWLNAEILNTTEVDR